ncbi:MAG: carbamoyltransferase C-terminal domain-containing protein [Polyangiaceae bacterium]
MRVLGYSGGLDGYPSRFGTSHDSAAAVVADGRVLAAYEEERFSREKHTGKFPGSSIEYCLKTAGVADLGDLALVCFYHRLSQMFHPSMLAHNRARMTPTTRLAYRTALAFMRRYNRVAGHSEERSLRIFRKRTGRPLPESAFRAVPHHVCHASSAFYPSPFEEALCLTLDAQGEATSAMLSVGRGHRLTPLRELYAPNSVGYLYSCITRYLGFAVGDDYKVMGLAPYGDPARFRPFFEAVVQSEPDGTFAVDPNWLSRLILRDALCPDGALYPRAMVETLGPARVPGAPFEDRHADIAAALQESLERVVLRMLASAREDTGQKNLCLAGGVALNCTLNGKIARSGLFEHVWVQPASHDAGTALGAALYGYHEILGASRTPEPRAPVYLGPEHGTASLSRALLELGPQIRAHRPADLLAGVARALAAGRIVGWFQGRAEWGPRALGHRSILADPRRPEMKDRVNSAVKMRESFRPFAPACLREHAADWFDLTGIGESPFMLFSVPVHEARRPQIPAVTHVDGSARLQTVDRDSSPRFHALLRAFHELTGVPVLLNTSFNVNGEPIVHSPADAIRCFLATRIDLLVIGDTVIEKRADIAHRATRPTSSASGAG